MEYKERNQFSEENIDESITIKEIFEKYLIHFKWFFFSVVICLTISFLMVRSEIPQFKISGVVLIKENEKGSSIDGLSAFEDLGLFGSETDRLENEIQILKSRKLMNKVVDELSFNISYFIEDSPYNKEYYPNFPVIVNFENDSTLNDDVTTTFKVKIKSKDRFEFIGFDDVSLGTKSFGKVFRAELGNDLISMKENISIELNPNFGKNLIDKTVVINKFPVSRVANNYLRRLDIEPINEKLSKVLVLSINESVREKGVALINNLIQQYNADGINDKNLIAQNTTNFLDLRIGLIAAEIAAIERTAEQFKTKNKMIDVNTGSSIYLQSSSANESEMVSSNTQIQLVNLMLVELSKIGVGELLPGNIGLSDPSIVGMISDYNNLVLQRNRILKSSSSINPIIVNIDSQLEVFKNNLNSSLNNQRSSLEIQISTLSNQSNKISSRIASVPKNEREFKDIVRQQETKNALYLFLLQKREESILSNAVSVDKAKIIDEAYVTEGQVSPKKPLII